MESFDLAREECLQLLEEIGDKKCPQAQKHSEQLDLGISVTQVG